MRWHQGVYDTGVALLEGRLDDAAALAQETYLLGRRVEHPYARPVLNGHRVQIARERGDAEQVLQIFARALGGGEGPMHWVQAVIARARLATGDEAGARVLLDELARDDFASIPRNLRWTGTLVEVAHLCAELDDAARARRLYDLLAPVEHQHGVLPMAICYGGPAKYALARLADTLGRRDDALALYTEAEAEADSLGARPTQARIALQHGLCLGAGDPARARSQLEEALRRAEALGLSAVADAACRALAR
jgi:ATP/maltotriose-dependent transcriptional regulator MalT